MDNKLDSGQTLLDAAVATGVIACPTGPSEDGNTLAQVAPRIELFTKKVKGRVTLFLGAAISTFKPAQLPMWNDFVELLWTSSLKVVTSQTEAHHIASERILSFFDRWKRSVPNYLVTEVIARRLGQQYLSVLGAFEAEKLADGTNAANNIHLWAAKCLASGDVAAVMTTNFDSYLEKAIEFISANHYQVSGDPHVDGREISARLHLTSQSKKLVLIVNGAKSFAFVRSLMPQLGSGKITFLFKLHGSCYDPPSCIDTRLQRAQGLPSFATDVLDTLLRRTVWMVAGFSGSDMNDNLDYLRFISNKRHASIVWLAFPGSKQEPAVHRLLTTLNQEITSSSGLCFLSGYLLGERNSGQNKFPRFNQKIENWAESLGSDWCKLLLIDLVALFEDKSGEKRDPKLLQAFDSGALPRQDWNPILSSMDLRDQQNQVAPARSCSEIWAELYEVILNGYPSSLETRKNICRSLNSGLKKLASHHTDLQSAALLRDPPRIHAQAWVVSALAGLAALCGGELETAMRAFEIANGSALVVGSYENSRLIEGVIAAIHRMKHFSSVTPHKGSKRPDGVRRFMAFSPAMDNVNSKMNRSGVPPQYYIRAILHRSILFADGMAVPANIISNSTVFVDEILFQGEIDQLNETYVQHVFPILPLSLKNSLRKLQDYRDSRRSGYILEPINESHLSRLDNYFNDAAHMHQVTYYDEGKVSLDYGRYSRMQVEPSHRETTVQHLIRLWNHIEARGKWDIEHEDIDRSSAAQDVARDLAHSLFHLSNHLPEAIYRSSLYRFADLFDEASDRQSFMKDLTDDTSEEAKTELAVARDRIIGIPWLYGPFCHELFDTPYRTTLAFDYALRSDKDTFIFLEEDEVPSWEFASAIQYSSESHTLSLTSTPITGNPKYSSLLLSQVPEATLLKTREDLGPIRAKLFSGSTISGEDVDMMKSLTTTFQSRSSVLPEVDIKELVDLDPPTKEAAKRLLAQCIFLVRKGPPLDPMYEEAQMTLPGLFALQHN